MPNPLQLYVLRVDGAREPSPFVWRIRMALAHKGLAAERVGIGYGEKSRLAFSGQGLVPVLVDGARWVNDSWAIAEYLEDAYPDRPSLFGGAAGRALALFVNRWADVALLGALRLLLWPATHDHTPAADQAYFRADREKRAGMTLEQMRADPEAKIDAFRRALEPMRQTLLRQPYLSGASPGYADYIVFGGFMWARSVADYRLLDSDDPVHRWRAALLDAFDGLAGKAVGYPV